MRFRPANIRLINRRSNLPRLLLALSSINGKSNDKNNTTNVQGLTGHSISGLCPEKKISGGKVLFTKSRRIRSRVATALRMCAQSLHHAKDYLGEFFRRITRKLGRPQAITATAHKLARIIFHLLTTKEAYNESVFHKTEEETIRRAQYRLRRQAAQLGFQVIPAENG